MPKKTRKRPSAQEKAAILRLYLLEARHDVEPQDLNDLTRDLV